MKEILAAPAPYGLLKDADGLITTVSAVNSAMVTASGESRSADKIDAHYATLTKEIATVQGDAALRVACLKLPGTAEAAGRALFEKKAFAHISQVEAEAIKEFDAAIARIEEFVRKLTEKKPPRRRSSCPPPPVVVKKQRIIKAVDLDEGATVPRNA